MLTNTHSIASLQDAPAPKISSPLDRPLAVTFFTSHQADTKRERQVSLRDLTLAIETTTAASKEALPWLKLARFGDTRSARRSLRHDGNVVACSGIEADYDDEVMTVEEACDRLRQANIAAVVYTSPSHTDAAPRWRVLCPLANDMVGADLAERRAELVGRINGVLGGVLSRESFTLSQSYYYGMVNDNPAHTVRVVEGNAIDLLPDLLVIGAPEPRVRKDGIFDWNQRQKPKENMAEADIERALRKEGDRSELAFTFINRLLRRGYSPQEIVDTVKDHAEFPVIGHYGDEYPSEDHIRADVQRAFVKENPSDRPAAQTFAHMAGGEQDQSEPEDEPDEPSEGWSSMVARFRGWTPEAGANLPAIKFLDEEQTLPLTNDGAVLVWYGPYSAGKTALAISCLMRAIKAHQARPPGERQGVPAVRVAYAVGEGVHGFLRQRVTAAASHFGIPLDVLARYWRTVPVPVLNNKREVKAFCCALAGLFDGKPPTVLVVDTLNTAAVGVEQNSNAIGELLVSTGAVGRVKRKLGGPLCLILDHEGKTEGRGIQGHNSKGGNADGVARVEFDKDTRRLLLHVEKMRDAEDGFALEFKVTPAGQVPVCTLIGRVDPRTAPETPSAKRGSQWEVRLALGEMGAIGEENSKDSGELAEHLARQRTPEGGSDADRQAAYNNERTRALKELSDGRKVRAAKRKASAARFAGLFAEVPWPWGASVQTLGVRWFLPSLPSGHSSSEED